jgi:hypothetical protein
VRSTSSLPLFALGLSVSMGWGCSAGVDDDGSSSGSGGSGSGTGNGNGSTGSFTTSGATGAGGGTVDDCVANAKLIYVVSVDQELYSFNPDTPGLAAYSLVGQLACPSTFGASPQSMSVDRNGTAWVFYDSGELFQVSTLDASCQATSYVHPVQNGFNQLGMGFTAVSEGSSEDQLYVVSPDFGLATVAFPSMQVSQLGVLTNAAELTGGPDAKLFHFAAANAALSEIDLSSGYSLTPVHTFNELAGTSAWAFSRYAGKFYLFTSPGLGFNSKTTAYDPATDTSTQRDADIGFTIVGAGQSICVPPPPPM